MRDDRLHDERPGTCHDETEHGSWVPTDAAFRALVENVGEGVGVVDNDERFVFINEAGARILGTTPEDVAGVSLRRFVTDEDWEALLEETERRRAGERSVYELTLVRSDGERRDVVVTAAPRVDERGEHCGTFGVFHDITERKAMEALVARSRETAQTLLDSSPGAAVLLDLELRIIALNEEAASLIGRTAAETVGLSARRALEGAVTDRVFRDLKRAAATGQTIERGERHGDRVLSVRIRPVFSSDGAVEGLALFARDVTDDERAQRALRASEARYRSVFELSPEAIVLLDRKGGVADANGRIADWLGYPREEIVGRHLLALPFIPPSSRTRIMKKFMERMAGRSIPPYDVVFVTRNGIEKTGRISATVLTDEDGRATHDIVMISDVTEEKRAETAMAESGHKLEELHGVVKRLGACTDLEEIYPLVTAAAKEILSIDACGLFIESNGLLSLAATCCRDDRPKPTPLPIDKAGHLGKAYTSGHMQLFSKDDVCEAMPAPAGFERGLSIPIEGIGVLHCFSTKAGAFTTEDVRLLDLLLDHAKQAAERISLEDRLREEAIRDRLTGLYNRHYFDEAIARETERSRRTGEPIGFLMLDTDRFKSINDTRGHAMGDLVLQGVARFLMGQVRTSEIVVRFGGDEFLIMLPGLTGDPEPVCDRIRRAFERWRGESGIPEDVDFGLSMGFARWEPYEMVSVEEILKRADRAMYADKRSHGGSSRVDDGRRTRSAPEGVN